MTSERRTYGAKLSSPPIPRYWPPADFKIYGLEEWSGERALDTYEMRQGARGPYAVWLSHCQGNGSVGVRVGTLSKQRLDEKMSTSFGDQLAAVADYAVSRLVSMTMPWPLPPEPNAYALLLTHGRAQAANWAAWDRVAWEVNGERISPFLWRFAGGWAALAESTSNSYIVALGIGSEPAGLHFVTITDGAAYRTDFAEPFDSHDPA